MAGKEKPDPERDAKAKAVAEEPKDVSRTEDDGPLILSNADLPQEADSAADSDKDVSVDDPKDTSDTTEDSKTEPESVIAPETAVLPEPQPEKIVERVVEKRGGFGTALLGGIVAAGLGFFAAKSDLLDPVLPESWKEPDASGPMAVLEEEIAAQARGLESLQSEVSGIEIPDLRPLSDQLGALSETIAPLQTKIDGLDQALADMGAGIGAFETRLTDLEKRPVTEGVSEAAIAAYERELASMQATVAQQRSEVEALIADAQAMRSEAQAMEQNAAAAAKTAATQASLAMLRGAMDTGAPYADLLEDLKSDGIKIPEVIENAAADGIVTVAALQARFPGAAREALSLARAEGDGKDSGIKGFLERQLGARSVSPREGDDPDAILSRAEEALTNGHLSQATSEISTLPDTARSALNEWTTMAERRLQAIDAADALVQSQNTN